MSSCMLSCLCCCGVLSVLLWCVVGLVVGHSPRYSEILVFQNLFVTGGLRYQILSKYPFGTRNVIVSGEAGFGATAGERVQWGARYHFTLMKTVAEIATPFDVNDEAQVDFYMGSTFGVDGMIGMKLGSFKPYAALGFTDVSTFFYIGDDAIVGNNASPYAGLTGSLGVQYTKDWLDVAGEFYTAPGYLYTGRLRAGVRF